MFNKESWINSYATLSVSWGTSTFITFIMYLKTWFATNLIQFNSISIPDSLLMKMSQPTASNDLIAFLTWLSATGLAIASGWSRWAQNKADARLKNAEATALERGMSSESIERTENVCRQHDCFFIDFYTKQKLEDMEEHMRRELEEQVRNEFQQRNIKYNANIQPTFATTSGNLS